MKTPIIFEVMQVSSYAGTETTGTISIKKDLDADIEGKDVYRVYYHERDLKRIAHYCENDVIATAQVYIRLAENRNTESLKVERVEWSDV